jgi:hypothetical protein
MSVRRAGALIAATCAAVLLGAGVVVADTDDDRATARRAAIRPADLAGWESVRSTGDDPPYPDDPACADLRSADRLAATREVHGPDFSLADEATEVEYGLEQTVVVFRSQRVATKYFDASTGPGTIACFEVSVRSSGGADDFALEAEEIAELTGDALPAGGDAAAGYHFIGQLIGTARLQGDDALPVVFDVFLVRVGRAVTVLSFSTVGSLEPVPETETITALAVQRLTAEI